MVGIGTRVGARIQILLAITAKDIIDAIKTKTVFSNLIFVLVMVVLYQWIPGLMYNKEQVIVYDEGDSALASLAGETDAYELHRVPSHEALLEDMAKDLEGELGLVIPADLDQQLASTSTQTSEPPRVEGYVMWSSRHHAEELVATWEGRLTALSGQPVGIDVVGVVRPQADSMGPLRFVAITLVITIVFVGVLTIPHLMFEEKRTRTLNALLVSPATIVDIVTGKALTGTFYCAIAAGLVLAFNWTFVTNWGLTAAAILCGTLLAVGWGLLLGTFLERREQMMIWALIPGQLLLAPVFLSFVDVILPPTVRTAMYWIPTVALTKLFRYGFSEGVTAAQIGLHLGIVLLTAFLVLAVVGWKVSRQDR
jgi:ABC-2 type transport system permease protein